MESDSFDLPGLISIAESHNPSLRAAAAFVDAARGQRLQSTLKPNPTFGYQAQEVGNQGRAGQHGLYWSQTWVTNGKLQLAGYAGEANVNARSWQYQAERFRVANRVRVSYYNLLAARRQVELSERIARLSSENLELVKSLFEAGEVGRNVVLQAEIEQRRAELRVENERTSQQTSERLLAIAVATPELDASQIRGDLLAPVPRISIDELSAMVFSESPELAAAKAAIDTARAQLQLELSRPVSNVTTQAGVSYDDSTGDAFGNFQVGLQLPIHNRNEGNIHTARANIHRAEAQLQQLKLAVKTRIETAHREYLVTQQRVALFEQSIMPTAKENLRITTASYKIGEASYQTLLTAQRSFLNTAFDLLDARLQLWQSVVRLQGLVVSE